MSKREAWHYDAIKGRPEWSKELGRRKAIEREIEKGRQTRRERRAA